MYETYPAGVLYPPFDIAGSFGALPLYTKNLTCKFLRGAADGSSLSALRAAPLCHERLPLE